MFRLFLFVLHFTTILKQADLALFELFNTLILPVCPAISVKKISHTKMRLKIHIVGSVVSLSNKLTSQNQEEIPNI